MKKIQFGDVSEPFEEKKNKVMCSSLEPGFASDISLTWVLTG